jgi:hypothetical protein
VILEGAIVLESEGMPPKRYGVGEAIFCKTRSEINPERSLPLVAISATGTDSLHRQPKE